MTVKTKETSVISKENILKFNCEIRSDKYSVLVNLVIKVCLVLEKKHMFDFILKLSS